MELRRFYTSPVNHHNLETWAELASTLERAVHESAPNVSVELGAKPVFGYGTDARAALEAESQLTVSPRHVRIDLWTSIVHYETICITFGSEVTDRERSAVIERLETKELIEEALLREVEDEYDIDSGQVYGYAFAGGDEDLQDIEWLLEPFDTPVYIGQRSCVLDENETIDEEAFDVFREETDVVIFIVKDMEATKRLWSSPFANDNEGLIAIYGGDEADNLLVDRFSAFDDLRILLADEPSAGMRVTIGRCHADDSLVVVYTPPEEPDIEQPLLFVI